MRSKRHETPSLFLKIQNWNVVNTERDMTKVENRSGLNGISFCPFSSLIFQTKRQCREINGLS
jgi:hypothetical protein